MEACQQRANGLSLAALERLREQERDGLFGQFD